MRDRKSDAHRTMTERELGRKLGPNELVHHVNEDKTDNSKANRQVESRSAHTTRHNKTRGVGRLVKALTMHKRGERVY